MEVHVNWLAVILATVSSMVVGSIWYARPVFGNLWIKLARVDTKNMANAPRSIALTVVASFITAYILAHVTYMAHVFFGTNSFLSDALQTVFWLWLGLTAARILVHDLFENRPLTLTLLTIGHELVTLLVMGLIIGLLEPTVSVN